MSDKKHHLPTEMGGADPYPLRRIPAALHDGAGGTFQSSLQAVFNVTDGDVVDPADVVIGTTAISELLECSDSRVRQLRREKRLDWVLDLGGKLVTLANSGDAFRESRQAREDDARRANQPKATAARVKRLQEGTLFSVHPSKKKPRDGGA